MNLELADIQGNVLYGYKYLPNAAYMFLHAEDKKNFQRWLAELKIQAASERPTSRCVNISLTRQGLEKLGIEVSQDNGFSKEFIQTMDIDYRNRVLGDIAINASSNWQWGSRRDSKLDCLLILFAENSRSLTDYITQNTRILKTYGITESSSKILSVDLGGKEHFGFADGLSNPAIRGFSENPQIDHNVVNAGEFIFGYQDNYKKIGHSPHLASQQFPLGKNGSYMVFRQMEQNVPLFWQTLLGYFSKGSSGKESRKQAIKLASEMVGRWPNGNPLYEEKDKKLPPEKLNNFLFYEQDKKGLHCPFGSHIRRTNPRDSFAEGSNPKERKESIQTMNNHRILRRGRPYGDPIVTSMEIADILDNLNSASHDGRGLNFICFNVNIDRQFEFVQQRWVNNHKFHGRYNDVDPLIGVQMDEEGNMKQTQFEVQTDPIRKQYRNIPPFVKILGGSYFFVPGIKAIKFLAQKS